MSEQIQVFTNAYLDSNVDLITSPAVPVRGNTAAMVATLKNLAGTSSPAVTLKVQGSYDGSAWEDPVPTSSFILDELENKSVSVGGFDYAFARINAEITAGTNPVVLFDASIVFSQQ